MIAPMLSGVVYFGVLSDFVRLLHDCNVNRVYFHSFWAERETEKGLVYNDCHCLAGLTAFANAFKIVVNGGVLYETSNIAQLVANRNLVGKEFRKQWKPDRGGDVRLIVGQVIDDRPPQSAWVPIDAFLAGYVAAPNDYPVVRYEVQERVAT